jgi:hypothetical protein
MAETRQTYSGPLPIGEDLMSFEIGETVGQTLQRQVITKARPVDAAVAEVKKSYPSAL